jgi:hypothetical protein
MSVGAAFNAVTDLGYDARLNAHELVRAELQCRISLQVVRYLPFPFPFHLSTPPPQTVLPSRALPDITNSSEGAVQDACHIYK